MLKSFLCMKHLTTLYVYSSWDVKGIWPKGGIGRLCSKKHPSHELCYYYVRSSLLPWHDAFVLIKMWYGLYNICVRYTLVLEWHVDFVWFCVSLRHIIYKHCWYLESWLDEFQLHIHTCYHQNVPKSKPWVFPKTSSFFDVLRFYRFGVLLVIMAKLWLYIIHL